MEQSNERGTDEMYVWFADSTSSQSGRFIRAWTDDAAKVTALRDAIGREPTQYIAALSAGYADGGKESASEAVAELLEALDLMLEWSGEVSDEYLDGDPEVRQQYLDDRKMARAAIAKVRGEA